MSFSVWPYWGRLSVETRQLILESLDQITPSDLVVLGDIKSPGWQLIKPAKSRSGYAVVNREFQHFFEARTVAYLQLSQEDLQEFRRIMAGQNVCRLSYVRRLWLRVVLPTYDCNVCQEPEDSLTKANNNAVMTRALTLLLETLSRWKKKDFLAENQDLKDMVLEISAHSPSDSQHSWLQMFGLRDSYPYSTSPSGMRLQERFTDWFYFMDRHFVIAKTTDGFHHLQNGYLRIRNLPGGAKARLFGAALELNFRNSPLVGRRRKRNRFPVVEIVTGLCFRRQFHRRLAPSMLGKLIDSFVCLQDIQHEFWVPSKIWTASQEDYQYEKELSSYLLTPGLPKTVRRLSLFRDFNHQFTGRESKKPAVRAVPVMAYSVFKASRHLEVLSSSWITDAADFFKVPVWNEKGGHTSAVSRSQQTRFIPTSRLTR
ncbi:hypothetical protein QBC40DRAFT_352013 [Triangularia verruculosa]|uniref:DUF6546 domain-containing protein n=1 Tax=Triangularia verruculosa TaxID=2587418 RepID=A0AAN6X8X1_9PEZI|nr:hypothetical protein QBC40DRAFT_352013 [Triangularia verruculosa]